MFRAIKGLVSLMTLVSTLLVVYNQLKEQWAKSRGRSSNTAGSNRY